jgi:hypothetical protein
MLSGANRLHSLENQIPSLTSPSRITASKRLRNNKYLLRVRILHFAARSIAAHVHVFARIIRAIYVSRFSGDRFGHRKLALIRRRAWRCRRLTPIHLLSCGCFRNGPRRRGWGRRRHRASRDIDIRGGRLRRFIAKLSANNRHRRGRNVIRSDGGIARDPTAHQQKAAAKQNAKGLHSPVLYRGR